MYDWMDWLNLSTNAGINHKMNSGKDMRVGPYLTDGYNSETLEIWEYMRCFFHGCKCMEWKEKAKQKERYDKTMMKIAFMDSKGYTVHIIWECQFKKQLQENETLKQFVRKRSPTFYRKFPSSCTESDILAYIVNEDFFGMLEVDIRIPKDWNETKYKPNTSLSPREFYDEMAPLFVTSEIPFEHIGDHMQKYAEKHGVSKTPRTLLLGGLRAKKLLLFSPLVKWYIEQGLVVTCIYEVIEYSKQKCFSKFVDFVSDARREGDKDKLKEIMGILCKLIWNSAFGGTIVNKERFLNV